MTDFSESVSSSDSVQESADSYAKPDLKKKVIIIAIVGVILLILAIGIYIIVKAIPGEELESAVPVTPPASAPAPSTTPLTNATNITNIGNQTNITNATEGESNISEEFFEYFEPVS